MSIKSRRMNEGMKTNLMQWRNLKINCLWVGKGSKSEICKMSPFKNKKLQAPNISESQNSSETTKRHVLKGPTEYPEQ